MAHIKLTANLQKYFPSQDIDLPGSTVLEILNAMEQIKPHFKSYIVDEHNNTRKHVNIFIDGQLVEKQDVSRIPIGPQTSIHLMQALSGG